MRLMMVCVFWAILGLQTSFAQLLPQGSDVNLYFPEVMDGGDSIKWQTTFIFLNPDDSTTATVDLFLLKDDGSGLSLDFGSGTSAHHSFSVPPRGSRTLKSTAVQLTTVAGWAVAETSIPIQATAAYRMLRGGVPSQEISVYPTALTTHFSSPASRRLGIALANRYTSDPIAVNLEIWDSEGRKLADTVQVAIPALGHKAFYVFEKFPSVADFSGTLKISAANSTYPMNDKFIAMTISEDTDGMWSGLPSGAFRRPQSDWERIQLVYRTVLNQALKESLLFWSPQLKIIGGNEINACAYTDGSTIEVTLGLSQLLNDSDSELAFAVAHELGHMIQLILGQIFYANKELDADVWGIILALDAGYDPYGAAGALGKLDMAAGSIGLIGQIFDDIFDPHTSFSNRLDNLHWTLNAVCGSSEISGFCEDYKRKYHPNFPPNTPLMVLPPK